MQEFKKFAVRGPVIMTRESVFERKSETEVILVFTTNGNVIIPIYFYYFF